MCKYLTQRLRLLRPRLSIPRITHNERRLTRRPPLHPLLDRRVQGIGVSALFRLGGSGVVEHLEEDVLGGGLLSYFLPLALHSCLVWAIC